MRAILAFIFISAGMLAAQSQVIYRESAQADSGDGQLSIADIINGTDTVEAVDTIEVVDSIPMPEMSMQPLPRQFFLPSVYSTYVVPPADSVSIFDSDYSGNPAMRWIEDANAVYNRAHAISQRMAISSPGSIRYIRALLPLAPEQYNPAVKPQDYNVKVGEIDTKNADKTTIQLPDIKKRHWIRAFNASLQFSQAYVSPNWYQGGNNNLNMLATIFYNVKLNQEYHPNLLFDTTLQYKLGLNSAPDDSIRNYSISEDLLQFNTTLGIKAARRWYYSFTAQFKTQLFNSYTSNTRDLRAAFLSPGEVNAGIGMTYNYNNKKKTFSFDASIAPLSYNLRICTDRDMDVTAFGIDPGKHSVHKFGSSVECKLMWKMAYNITLNSRLFGFTDYNRGYFDWENTLVFEVNRFLTTQIYAHLRYDSHTPKVADQSWRKLQLKEILSIGFAYKFSSI